MSDGKVAFKNSYLVHGVFTGYETYPAIVKLCCIEMDIGCLAFLTKNSGYHG